MAMWRFFARKAKFFLFVVLFFVWLRVASTETPGELAVAKVARERNDDASSDNSDHELPSKKLLCYHRLYDWIGNETLEVTCDAKSDKCAYVYISYYDSASNLIRLLSQHCNHYLSARRRQSHCDAMNNVIKLAGNTPYTKCEMKECDQDLCNKPFESGMRPAWIVLICLTSSAGVFLLLICICCILACCTDPAVYDEFGNKIKQDADGKVAKVSNENAVPKKNDQLKADKGTKEETQKNNNSGNKKGNKNNNNNENNNNDNADDNESNGSNNTVGNNDDVVIEVNEDDLVPRLITIDDPDDSAEKEDDLDLDDDLFEPNDEAVDKKRDDESVLSLELA